MRTSTANSLKMIKDIANITNIIIIASHVWAFDWHIYSWLWSILKIKDKVEHILTANILNTVKDTKNISITIKYDVIMGLRLAYLHLTVTNSKGQGNANFDSEYLENGER